MIVDREYTIYLVYSEVLGGYWLRGKYLRDNEAEDRKNQMIKKGYKHTWIEEITVRVKEELKKGESS